MGSGDELSHSRGRQATFSLQRCEVGRLLYCILRRHRAAVRVSLEGEEGGRKLSLHFFESPAFACAFSDRFEWVTVVWEYQGKEASGGTVRGWNEGQESEGASFNPIRRPRSRWQTYCSPHRRRHHLLRLFRHHSPRPLSSRTRATTSPLRFGLELSHFAHVNRTELQNRSEVD